jgi:uncharacterized protein (DUF3084 family)
MQDEAYVKILRESLEKKVELLNLISNENEIQSRVLSDPNATPDEFQATIDNKDKWITDISTLDNGFSAIFEKVKPLLENQKSKYRDEIARMKDLVRQITDLTTQVEKQEKENYLLAQQKFAGVRKQVQKIRKSQSAVSTYYKSMNGSGYDAQFLDSTN